MKTAKSIQNEAKKFIDSDLELKEIIEAKKQNPTELFDFFIEKVKEDEYLIVSYILNYCFDDAETRANFGNTQDENGNTAYHYAAEYGHDEIIIILNDKRKFNGDQKFFQFTLRNNEHETPLDICCKQGHLTTFELIWEQVKKSSHNPMTSLRSACEGKNPEIVRRMLKHPKFDKNDPVVDEALSQMFGAQVYEIFHQKFNPQYWLSSLIQRGKLELLKDLLEEKGVDVNELTQDRLPLELIPVKNKKADEILKALLEKGANPLRNGGKAIERILKNKSASELFKQIVNNLVQNNSLDQININGMPFIFFIIEHGNKSHVAIFLEECKKQKIDLKKLFEQKYQDKPPLIYALHKKKLQIAQLLLERGASPDQTDEDQTTVLHYLVRVNDLDFTVKFIEKYKPDVHAQNQFGKTCLHQIANFGDDQLIEYFLQQGLAINHQDGDGNTPLLIALKKIHDPDCSLEPESLYRIMSMLLANGAEVTLENHEGESVVSLLEAYCNAIVENSSSSDSGVEKSSHNISSEEDFASNASEQETSTEFFDARWFLQQFHKKTLKHRALLLLKQELGVLFRDLREKPIVTERRVTAELEQILDDEVIITDFLQQKIKQNAEEAADTDLATNEASEDEAFRQRLSDACEKIIKASYLDFRYVHLLFTITNQLMEVEGCDPESYIQERLPSNYIKNENNDYFYTVCKIENQLQLFRLTSTTENPPAKYLITTLVYEAKRHGWKDKGCQLHHQLIQKVDPKYQTFELAEYEQELEQIEQEDYFGENISYDTDSEQEQEYQRTPQRKKHLISEYTKELFFRAQPEEVLTKERELRKKFPKEGRLNYDLEKRQSIVRSESIPGTVQRDLETLSTLAIKGELSSETIKMISNKFYIAQYRGIAYRTDEFSAANRQAHRKTLEIGKPLFSKAAIHQNGYGSYTEYFSAAENNPALEKPILATAEQIQSKLLQLKLSGPIRIKFTSKSDTYTFDNALLALQDFYTKKYSGFHALLKAFVKKFTDNDASIQELKEAIALSINSEHNPLVSTSDTPDHALRYAYGKKFYKEYKELRLRPRWRLSGKAERPYSGKVYVSLHEPLELFTQSHHIVSLDFTGKTHINKNTSPERETSFFGFIPSGRVVSQHVAKFPSFQGDYKQIYFEKYGLSKELYEKFQAEFQSTKPHTPEREHYKNLLTQHLISYQEVCLIEEARIAAESLGGYLIYRNQWGGFSLFPCQTAIATRSKDENKKAASSSTTDYINNKRAKRKADDTGIDIENPSKRTKIDSDSNEKPGFLNHLFAEFNIQPCIDTLVRPLIASLAVLLGKDKFVLNKKREKFNSDNEFLEFVAQSYSVLIRVYDPTIVNSFYREIGNPEHQVINLYFLGGDDFAALNPREQENTPRRLLK